MISSKLTSKAQTVLPVAVREYLGVGPGDELVYELKDGQVVLRARKREDDPFVHFDEWSSDEDEQLFRDL
ncbi:type II toxin-antitoxin system PrlF family antitoxin [Caenispirillum salinarum]|uniref:type II toxin-antitoxin system PrlF family antitoxin n=1 Tax=Caenispirillum salinarum TaxID=859058 RepID=UPI00385016C9